MTITLDLSRSRDAAAAAPARRPNLTGLTRPALVAALEAGGLVQAGKAKMRASQLWRWMHHYGVTDFALMTDVAKELRAALSDAYDLSRPEVVERQVSVDGTRKWLIRMAPGVEVETVYIPDVGRSGALCVSSQVGCTLNCTFCHTGTQPLVRNLTAAEIVAQVQVARDELGEWPSPKEDRRLSNIVFMGMGEPELKALGERTQAMLAISLHATNDALRDELVPINRKYPIAELLAGIRAYPGLGNARRVTFEYVMLKGVNDSPAEARALVNLLAGVPAKINLIPFNPWPGSPYVCSDWGAIEAFAAVLNRAGYASPIRTPRGRDILAACGQLKSESEKERASVRLARERAIVAGDSAGTDPRDPD